jgi:hypothetical protein
MTGKYSEAHKAENLAGPGDARPTALQIIKDNNLLGKMTDKGKEVTVCLNQQPWDITSFLQVSFLNFLFNHILLL